MMVKCLYKVQTLELMLIPRCILTLTVELKNIIIVHLYLVLSSLF